jgi:hypothetical protein
MNTSRKPLPIVLKAVIIYTCSFVAGLVTSGLFGKLYRYIVGPYKDLNVGVVFSEWGDNFLGGLGYGYVFFVGLFTGLFVQKKFWLIWLIGFMILGWLSFWSLKDFSASLALSLLGFLLGRLILVVKNRAKK